jgi:hypothetical protein
MFKTIVSKINESFDKQKELEDLKEGSIIVDCISNKDPKVLSQRVQEFLNQLQNSNCTVMDMSYVNEKNLGFICFITYNIEEVEGEEITNNEEN